jgi:hypothetical protein
VESISSCSSTEAAAQESASSSDRLAFPPETWIRSVVPALNQSRVVGLAAGETELIRHYARMTEVLDVNVTDLRRAVGRLLDEVEQRHGPTVALGADHYWMLSDEAAFALRAEPTAEGILAGQLSDDVDAVRELVDRSHDEVAVWHDLRHVIGVLSRIAAQDRPAAHKCRSRSFRPTAAGTDRERQL